MPTTPGAYEFGYIAADDTVMDVSNTITVGSVSSPTP
jgi:hypothetical protein